MKLSAREKDGAIQAEVSGGAGSIAPIPELHAASLPPGVAPQIDLESLGRSTEAEPFLAPTPQRGGILGYGNARVGRVPPHGGSPSSGPLTGLPLRAPPPVPPAFRKQALEPGHQEPDPFSRIPAVEVVPRAPGEDLARNLDRLERSAAAIRAVRPSRRGGAGRHQAVAAAAGPAGTGGANVAASLGVPVADSVRTSDRGVYVAGRASGAKWDVNATVAAPGRRKVRDVGMDDGCASPGTSGRRPLTPLQSVRRYAQQQTALQAKIQDTPGPEVSRPPEVQPVGVSGPGTKGMSTGTKAFSKMKGAPPARSFAGMEGRQSDDTGARPDPESERRLLALRAEIGGLAGRFGARPRRCGMDTTEAMRPAAGHAELGRSRAPMRTKLGGQGQERRSPLGGRTSPGPGAPRGLGDARADAPAPSRRRLAEPAGADPRAASLPADGGCAVPQKYPARAGVAMRDSAAADASEAAPPGGPGPAQADEGIPTGRQGPLGQQAYPPQSGADAQARDEAGPGAAGGGAPGGQAARPPVVAAQGMGGPSTPVLLDIDRAIRREANARIDAQMAAQALHAAIEEYGKAIAQAGASSTLVLKNAQFADELKRAVYAMFGQGGQAYTGALDEALSAGFAALREIEAQAKGADESNLLAAFLLAQVDEASKQAAAAIRELERQQRGIRDRARVLGNMDDAALRRRALEAGHRAERDSYRAERRALRRERGGVFRTRQFAQVIASTERAFEQERRATRYAAQAARMKEGAARDRAQARADYHGSLAEAERHRASVARSHILGPEIARAKGVREFLRAERARTDEYYRNERKLAELNRFRATHAVYERQLESIDGQLDALVEKDRYGFPKKEDGKHYKPRDPQDARKVRDLQREQERLERKLWRKLGKPRRGPGGRSWANINILNARQNVLASGGAAVPAAFAGTPAGTLMAARRDPTLGPVALALIEAQINSLMSTAIAEASARSEAAFQAGLDAGLAMHNEKLSDEEREAAASTYADALAGAAKAVSDIENAIAEKRRNGAYFESGWGEYDEDQKKLAKAKERLAALQNVCNSHRACAQAKQDCEAESTAEWYCRLVPSSGGGDRGDGSSTSSVGASAAGASGPVSPGGSNETDGKDDSEEKKEDDEARAVEPSEAQPKERRTVSTEPRPDDKKKKAVPTPPGGDGTTVFRDFNLGGGGILPFAYSIVASAQTNPIWWLVGAPPPDDDEEEEEEEEAYRGPDQVDELEEDLLDLLAAIDDLMEAVGETETTIDDEWSQYSLDDSLGANNIRKVLNKKPLHREALKAYIVEIARTLPILRREVHSDLATFLSTIVSPGGRKNLEHLRKSADGAARALSAIAAIYTGIEFWLNVGHPLEDGISVPKDMDRDNLLAALGLPQPPGRRDYVLKSWDLLWRDLSRALDPILDKLGVIFPKTTPDRPETGLTPDLPGAYVMPTIGTGWTTLYGSFDEYMERYAAWLAGGFQVIEPTGLNKPIADATDEFLPFSVLSGVWGLTKSLGAGLRFVGRQGATFAKWLRYGSHGRRVVALPEITGAAAANKEVVDALGRARSYLESGAVWKNRWAYLNYLKQIERAKGAAYWIDRGFEVVATEFKVVTRSGTASFPDLLIRHPSAPTKLYVVEVGLTGKKLSKGQEAVRAAVEGREPVIVKSGRLKGAGIMHGHPLRPEGYMVQKYRVGSAGELEFESLETVAGNGIAPEGVR